MQIIPEILHLELSEGKVLAVAIVRIGVVEIERVRVVERDGKLSVRLLAVQEAGGRPCPTVRLPPDMFKAMHRAVMDEYRRAPDADPWADMRRIGWWGRK